VYLEQDYYNRKRRNKNRWSRAVLIDWGESNG
jgi:hypothetical protein